MRAPLAAAAAALALTAAPADAVHLGAAYGDATVTPAYGAVVSSPLSFEIEVYGREGGCYAQVVERTSTAAAGYGTGILDCGGTLYGYGVCTAERAVLTITLTCPTYEYGGGVFHLQPPVHASEEGTTAFAVTAFVAFVN